MPLLGLSLAALVLVAVVAEIAVRIDELLSSGTVERGCAGSGATLSGQKGLFRLDPDAGYTMRPNVCVRLRSTEYDQVLVTNARGLVGPDVPASKAPGEFRIVVLGDSYTASGQVPYEQTFTALLEQQLRARDDAQVRVVNAGVGGYTTFNEAGLLGENVGWLQPDLVIVAVFLGNDVAENVLATAGGYREAPEHPKGVTWGPAAAALLEDSHAWFPRNGPPTRPVPPPWDPTRPLPSPVGNAPPGTPPAHPAGNETASRSPWGVLRQAGSAVWDGTRVRSRLLGTLFGEPIDPSVTTAPGAAPSSTQQKPLNLGAFEWTILREVPRTYWLDVAWPLFGRYLGDIKAIAGAVGAPVVVLAIPEPAQVKVDLRARSMADYRFREDEVDWGRPQRELRAQSHALHLVLLDLLPVFVGRADREGLYFALDTHFTALGHQATAEALARFLEAGGWLP